MSAPTVRRVLPADVFDALEFSALAYGGIGAGRWTQGGAPLCAVGHAVVASGGHDGAVLMSDTFHAEIVLVAPWLAACEDENDRAVRAINTRRKRERNARVSFADWCAELGVERGS